MAINDRQTTIGTIAFSSLTDDKMLQLIADAITAHRRMLIAYANQHCVTVAESNEAYRQALARYTYIQPDGIGVHWAAKVLARPFPSEIVQTGTDFYFKLLALADARCWHVYFLGDEQTTLDALRRHIEQRYPGIIIAGCRNGFFDMADSVVPRSIAMTHPSILVVGMGVPRQELWISRYADMLDEVPVVISVGAGLRFMAGVTKRAPVVFRRAGLEWLFRLLREPRRLWRRYLWGIPFFCYLVFRQKFGEGQ